MKFASASRQVSDFRQAPRRSAASRRRQRKLLFEPLEARTLLDAGDLDPTFSGDGFDVQDYAGSSDSGWEAITDTAGNVVVVGRVRDGAGDHVGLWRYTSAGVLDTTFGGGDGFVVSTATFYDASMYLRQDSAGGYVVGASDGDANINLLRFTAAGVLDTSFGTNGVVRQDFGYDIPVDLDIDGAGKIVVTFFSGVDGGTFGVARFTPTGAVDTTFGGGAGFVTASFNGNMEFPGGLIVDGTNYVVGGTFDMDADRNFGIARFTSTGALDSTFGTGGMTWIDNGGNSDVGYGLAFDGTRYFIIGVTHDGQQDVAVVAVTRGGALDPTFSGDGIAQVDLGTSTDEARDAVADGGKIAFTGWVANRDLLIGRLTPAGVLDATFGGGDGFTTTDVNSNDSASRISLDPQGRYLVAGYTSSRNGDAIVARYEGNGTANAPPTLTVDHETVTVDEGQTATNGGTASDPDGHPIAFMASVGSASAATGASLLGTPFNTADNDLALRVSHDGLRAYFGSDRPGGHGGYDIYVTSRTSLSSPWGTPVNVGSAINFAGHEASAVESADGLTLYFEQTPAAIRKAVRPTVATPWSDPSVVVSSAEFANVNAVGTNYNPTVSADGLTLIVQNNSFGPGLLISTRATTADNWSSPTALSNLNAGVTVHPMLAHDDLSLYFASNRAGGAGGTDIWRATRANTSIAWTDASVTVALADGANSTADDLEPSAFGSTVYVASNRTGGPGQFDLYSVRGNGWTWSFDTTDGDSQSQTVTITADDGQATNNTDDQSFELVVRNVAPMATFGNGGAVNPGSTGSVSFTSPSDPSSVDTAAGFHYAFDFDDDGTFEVGDGTYVGSGTSASATVPASFLATPGTRTVTGRIIDKDDGHTDYETTITINAPSLSINDVSLAEGNSGSSQMVFTVSLSFSSDSDVTAAYATTNGTATAGSDYTAASGTLTIPAGQTTGTVTVTVTGDTAFEANETFTVNLSNPTIASIGDGTGTGTITNDEATPALSINDVSRNEGPVAGSTNFVFTVTLSAIAGSNVTASFATSDGTATAGADYTAAIGTVTIPAGQTTGTVTVTVLGDALTEPDETFSVGLSNASGGIAISDATGQGTIVNDDAPPTIVIGDVSQAEGTGGTTAFVFTVSLSNPSGSAVTVNYATSDGSASMQDYAATNGTLTIAAGATSTTVTVNVVGDSVQENNETFLVNLSTPSNATIADFYGVGTILNDDAAPSLSIAGASANEGHAGTSPLTFTVTLSYAASQTVQVSYATGDGTAVAASGDYSATGGVLYFSPGTTVQTIAVQMIGDTQTEPDETLSVVLSSPSNATIGTGTATGTILNDDALPSVSIAGATVYEGHSGQANAVFTVSLSGASASAITVGYATANGSATAGSDYSAATGTLTFAPGQTQKPVTVAVTGDTLAEANETFSVTLSAPTNATLGTSTATGTILNDDAVPNLSIGDVSVTEGNAGTTNAVFVLSLNAAAGMPVTVSFETINSTARSGTDFDATSGTATIPAGQTTGTVTVMVLGETTPEPDEFFFVGLSNPSGAAITDGQGMGTIRNDDTTVGGVKRFDFNSAGSPTAGGFTGVLPTQQYNAANGYGYLEVPSLGGFNRAGDTSMTTDDLYRDGHAGLSNVFGGAVRFRVKADPGQESAAHDVRLYVGDRTAVRNHIRLRYVQGATQVTSALANTAANQFTSVTLTNLLPIRSTHDGFYYLDLVIEDTSSTFDAPSYQWSVNGLDVALSSVGLPAVAPLAAHQPEAQASALADGSILTEAALAPIVAEAIARWSALGLTPEQLTLLSSVEIVIRDLDGESALGLAGSRRIELDDDALGHGWFVDPTPADDAEFAAGITGGRGASLGEAAAAVDLLSTVLHELGHVLGLPDRFGDSDRFGDLADLMHHEIGRGERRVPTALQMSDFGATFPTAASPARLSAASADGWSAQVAAALSATTDFVAEATSSPVSSRSTARSPINAPRFAGDEIRRPENVALAPNTSWSRTRRATIDELILSTDDLGPLVD